MLVFYEVELLDWIVMFSESPYYWRHRCVPKDYKALFGREKFHYLETEHKSHYLETEHYNKSKVGSRSGFCPSQSKCQILGKTQDLDAHKRSHTFQFCL